LRHLPGVLRLGLTRLVDSNRHRRHRPRYRFATLLGIGGLGRRLGIGGLGRRRRLPLAQQPESLGLLLRGEFDACAATEAIGDHQPQADRHRGPALGAGTGEHVAVEPDAGRRIAEQDRLERKIDVATGLSRMHAASPSRSEKVPFILPAPRTADNDPAPPGWMYAANRRSMH